MWSDNPRSRRLVAAGGVSGAVMLAAYFVVPLFVSPLGRLLYAAHPTTTQVVEIGKRYHELIYAGCWLQATGGVLAAIFFLALADVAGKTRPLAAKITQLGSAVLLAAVLAEVLFSLTWASMAVTGQTGSSRVSYDLTSAFVRVFPLVPAPAIYLSIGVLLQRERVLPRAFGQIALVLGSSFAVAGLLGTLVPSAAVVTAGLAGLQVFWLATAAIALWQTSEPPLPNVVQGAMDGVRRGSSYR